MLWRMMTFKIVVVCLNNICNRSCLVERKPFPVRSGKGFFAALLIQVYLPQGSMTDLAAASLSASIASSIYSACSV